MTTTPVTEAVRPLLYVCSPFEGCHLTRNSHDLKRPTFSSITSCEIKCHPPPEVMQLIEQGLDWNEIIQYAKTNKSLRQVLQPQINKVKETVESWVRNWNKSDDTKAFINTYLSTIKYFQQTEKSETCPLVLRLIGTQFVKELMKLPVKIDGLKVYETIEFLKRRACIDHTPILIWQIFNYYFRVAAEKKLYSGLDNK